MELTVWLKERESNARRIAETKTGDDRAGWFEDAEYFQGAREAVRERAVLRAALFQAQEAAKAATERASAWADIAGAHGAQADRLRAVLLDCARQAEALKRECGMDPESAQAVRNAQYQSISTAAHIALGTISGPQGA